MNFETKEALSKSSTPLSFTTPDKDVNYKIRTKVEEHVAEAVKLKLEDLNNETEKIHKREQELKQQEREFSEKLFKVENDIQPKTEKYKP